MTFPLGSLRNEASSDARVDRRPDAATSLRVTGRLHRSPVVPTPEPVEPIETTFRFQAGLLIGGVLLMLSLLALASHSILDPAFTTSGTHLEPVNWGGHAGAYASDLALMLLGQSAWWCPIIGFRVWLSALARWLRRDATVSLAVASPSPSRALFWLGVVLLLSARCSLEW